MWYKMAAISDMKCKNSVPEFFPYPCGGGILTVKSNCNMTYVQEDVLTQGGNIFLNNKNVISFSR